MRVGLVPFLNVAPFRDIPFEITYAVPTVLNRLMREKKLDVAFCSSIELCHGAYERLPGLGLAARGAIRSVNLYLKDELAEARIRLDPRSETSNALLRLLCGNTVTFCNEGESFLLIGDEALRLPCIEGFETIDLAKWWFERTSLPFVFALFIKQKGCDSTCLEEALHHALENFGPQIDGLAEKHAIPKCYLREYYSLCHYRLGPQEEEGLSLFHQLAGELL